MSRKVVVQLDAAGFYLGPAWAYESPLEPGVYPLPAGAVDAPLPEPAPDMLARWSGSEWVYEPAPLPEEDPQPSHQELETLSRLAAKSTAISMLPLLTSMQVDAIASGEEIETGEPPAPVAVSSLIKSFKDQLLAIPDSVDLSACTTRAEMDDAIQAAYFALVMGVPVELRARFAAMVPR